MTNCFSEFSAVYLDYCPEYLISKKGLSHQTNLVRQPHRLTILYIADSTLPTLWQLRLLQYQLLQGKRHSG